MHFIGSRFRLEFRGVCLYGRTGRASTWGKRLACCGAGDGVGYMGSYPLLGR